MAFLIGNDLYGCQVGNRIAFLDLPKDRYFCLPEAANDRLLRRLAERPVYLFADDLPTELFERWSGEDGALRLTAVRSPPAVDTSLCEGRREPASPIDVLEAVMRQRSAKKRLQSQPLSTILGRLMARANRVRTTATSRKVQIGRIAAAYRASRLIVNNHDQCLQRSIAMLDTLSAQNLFPDLVIGVKFKPFAAHAWVQEGACVLNDEVDNVAAYTPILVA